MGLWCLYFMEVPDLSETLFENRLGSFVKFLGSGKAAGLCWQGKTENFQHASRQN